MKKLGLSVLVVVALSASAAPVAGGVTPGSWGWSWASTSTCGGGAFTTCMSGQIGYNGMGTITVFVQNAVPYAGDVFTTVGLFNLPVGVLPSSFTADNGFTHAKGNASEGLNGLVPGTTRRYAIGANGLSGGFGEDAGHWFTFSFAQSNWAALALAANTIGVGVHAQGGPRGCSVKLGVTGRGSSVVYSDDAGSCASVPEPDTIALLATGLAALAFVAIRRRHGFEIVDEDGNDVAI